MAIKSFNVQEETYKQFSEYCRQNGINMSKQIEFFMQSVIAEPEVKQEYLAKLERIRKQKSIKIGVEDFKKRYGVK